jgi:hypothetical protein
MKKLLTILLILTALSTTAQERWQNYTRIGLTTGSVVLNAAGDAMMDEGEKVWGHSLRAASIAILLINPLITEVQKEDWLPYVLQYAFIRFAVFDYTYNATRGLPIGYTGNTSMYDKAMQKVPNSFEAWSKGIFLTVGITINLREL